MQLSHLGLSCLLSGQGKLLCKQLSGVSVPYLTDLVLEVYLTSEIWEYLCRFFLSFPIKKKFHNQKCLLVLDLEYLIFGL